MTDDNFYDLPAGGLPFLQGHSIHTQNKIISKIYAKYGLVEGKSSKEEFSAAVCIEGYRHQLAVEQVKPLFSKITNNDQRRALIYQAYNDIKDSELLKKFTPKQLSEYYKSKQPAAVQDDNEASELLEMVMAKSTQRTV